MSSLPLQMLAYFSRSRLAPDPAQAEREIAKILDSSRRNNRALGITGALLVGRELFGQVIEGPRDSIEATFERIACDARHDELVVLWYGTADERSFADWSMACVDGRSDAVAAARPQSSGGTFVAALVDLLRRGVATQAREDPARV